MILIAVRPEPYLDAAYRGYELFVSGVLPSLVPFAFITSFMSLTGSAEVLFKLLSRPAKRMFSTSGSGGYVFAVSLISGYPIGAKTISELKRSKCISDEETTAIAAFGSTAGPLFVIGTVGAKLLGDSYAGGLIFLSHIIGSVLNGAVFGRLYGCRAGGKNAIAPKPVGAVSAFGQALGNTVRAALTVVSCMILFNVLAAIADATGLLRLAGAAFEKLGVPSGAGEGLAAGLIEVTLGVKSLAMLPVKQAAPLIAALVSFGGFSVQMQSMFYLEEAGVKGSTFICLKIAQTVFAYAAASLIFAFLTL